MGAASRNKGSAFERKVAKAFNEAFRETMRGVNIRRVPLSGALDIKADLYDPNRDDFRYWVECKNRKTYRFASVFSCKSELFDVHMKTTTEANQSAACKKYGISPFPIVVFRGGDFTDDMVLYRGKNIQESCIVVGVYRVVSLATFLSLCNKTPLTRGSC